MPEGVGWNPAGAELLLLLLRSSGDEQAEQSRVRVLRAFAERLAALAGWAPGDLGENAILLRAELVLAAAMGIRVLRALGAPEPLMSATETELAIPGQLGLAGQPDEE